MLSTRELSSTAKVHIIRTEKTVNELRSKDCNIYDVFLEALKKIENDTGNFYSKDKLKHYVLIAENHIMEVVSFDDVKIVS